MKQRYQTGKIYQIVNDVNDQVYIGSTCMPLSKRLYSHKKDCKNGCSQRQLFVLAREHGWSHFRIRLLGSYPCDDNNQLRMTGVRKPAWGCTTPPSCTTPAIMVLLLEMRSPCSSRTATSYASTMLMRYTSEG